MKITIIVDENNRVRVIYMGNYPNLGQVVDITTIETNNGEEIDLSLNTYKKLINNIEKLYFIDNQFIIKDE